MTLKELYTILKKTNFPVAYLEFKSAPTIPFIVYFEESREHILADDSIYKKFKNIRIELYTEKKNVSAEENLESVLETAGLIYEYAEVGKIESENLFEVVYTIQI